MGEGMVKEQPRPSGEPVFASPRRSVFGAAPPASDSRSLVEMRATRDAGSHSPGHWWQAIQRWLGPNSSTFVTENEFCRADTQARVLSNTHSNDSFGSSEGSQRGRPQCNRMDGGNLEPNHRL
jgi:hypothetical protein